MSIFRRIFTLGVAAGAVPQTAFADTLSVSGLFAGGISWGQVLSNIIGTLTGTIVSVAGAAFLIGAMMYVGGFVSEENKSKGKNLMIGSLFGMGIVVAAKTIFDAAFFFVYGS